MTATRGREEVRKTEHFADIYVEARITSVSCLGATPTVVIADAEAAELGWPAMHSGLSEMEME